MGDESREEKFMRLISAIKDFVRDNGLRWICIFDQMNGLYSDEWVVGKYPFSLVKSLPSQYCFVIWCASANNEDAGKLPALIHTLEPFPSEVPHYTQEELY